MQHRDVKIGSYSCKNFQLHQTSVGPSPPQDFGGDGDRPNGLGAYMLNTRRPPGKTSCSPCSGADCRRDAREVVCAEVHSGGKINERRCDRPTDRPSSRLDGQTRRPKSFLRRRSLLACVWSSSFEMFAAETMETV